MKHTPRVRRRARTETSVEYSCAKDVMPVHTPTLPSVTDSHPSPCRSANPTTIKSALSRYRHVCTRARRRVRRRVVARAQMHVTSGQPCCETAGSGGAAPRRASNASRRASERRATPSAVSPMRTAASERATSTRRNSHGIVSDAGAQRPGQLDHLRVPPLNIGAEACDAIFQGDERERLEQDSRDPRRLSASGLISTTDVAGNRNARLMGQRRGCGDRCLQASGSAQSNSRHGVRRDVTLTSLPELDVAATTPRAGEQLLVGQQAEVIQAGLSTRALAMSGWSLGSTPRSP